jgi:hypothetical protein
MAVQVNSPAFYGIDEWLETKYLWMADTTPSSTVDHGAERP